MRNTFKSVLLFVATATIAAGCKKAPDTVTFDGHALKKATDASLANGLDRVVYSADGDEGKLKSAPEVLTVVWSDDGSPEKTLSSWVDAATAGISLDPWYAATQGTTSCRAIRAMQSGRFALSVTSCAKVKKHNACADWEEVVGLPCSVNDEPCHSVKAKALCDGRVDKLSSDLEEAMHKVAQ